MGTQPGQPKKIVFYHDSHDYGGMELYLFRLIHHLDRSRFQPALLVSGYTDAYRASPQKVIQSARDAGIPLLRPPQPVDIPGYRVAKDVSLTARLLRSHGADIVHIHTCRPEGARKITVAARLAGVKGVVRTEHYPPSVTMRPATRYWVKPFDLLTDCILTGSEGDRQQQINLLKRPRDKVVRCYNSIELEQLDPQHDVREAKKNILLDPEIPVVCTVGRLVYQKGQVDLIRAMARVIEKVGPVNLLLVGDGDLRQELETAAQDLGIAGFVHFVGFQEDVTPYMKAADIAVMPSLWEVFSLAMLEFMALGKPIVTSDHSSFLEALTDGENGLIVPVRDSQRLANAIITLLNDEDLRRCLGKAARGRVEANFSIHRLAAEMMDLFDRLPARGQSSRLLPEFDS